MTNPDRQYSRLDQLCLGFDQALRALRSATALTERPYPAAAESDAALTARERKQAASLMRVNHTGEVCAQALYHAQGLFSRNPEIQKQMQHSAIEEGDHLNWCNLRLQELQSHTSYLNPLWYTGSFVMGAVAGIIGDKWSLGFVAETETQVVKHLEKHLELLPAQDAKSIKILEQMHTDESHHRDEAIKAGAAVLPDVIKKLMTLTSKIMVKTAYWI
jgi:ubiquinone biosynthesis monooxygenase Coq7